MIKSLFVSIAIASLSAGMALAQGKIDGTPKRASQVAQAADAAYAQGPSDSSAFASRTAAGTRPSSAPYLPGAYNNLGR